MRIYDDEGLQAAEFIGCCQISLSTLEPGKVKDVWLKLLKDLDIQKDTKYRGQVRMASEFSLFSICHRPYMSYI